MALPRRPSARLAALLGAALAVAAPAARAADPPRSGVISRPKGFSTIRLVAPPGLFVFLGDVPVGTTDVLRQGLWLEDLPAGRYVLRVEKPGFEPKVVTVVVGEGDTKEVRVLALRPRPTPTPAPPETAASPAPTPPAASPAPVRAVVLERKPVPGGTLVTGIASSAVDALPLLEELKTECRCAPALESMTKRKDGLYEFRVKLPGT
ncbi:MAG TPA: PEGA domain-containing protein [Thermoanaerobaculia bacterium]|nr:PEGA domain-containing protein [Thermoanaerobaculia bacterium]